MPPPMPPDGRSENSRPSCARRGDVSKPVGGTPSMGAPAAASEPVAHGSAPPSSSYCPVQPAAARAGSGDAVACTLLPGDPAWLEPMGDALADHVAPGVAAGRPSGAPIEGGSIVGAQSSELIGGRPPPISYAAAPSEEGGMNGADAGAGTGGGVPPDRGGLSPA
eukprot:6959704-Prymnesium_polylepis.1